METVVQPQDDNELRLLLDWGPAYDRQRWQTAVPISVAAHVLAIVALLFVPRDATPARPVARAVHVTPLIAPPTELTQKAPNKGKISKEFNVEALLPRPRIQIPESAPSTTRPAAPRPAPAAVQPAAPLPEPPKIEAAARENPPKLAEAAPPPPRRRFKPRKSQNWRSKMSAGLRRGHPKDQELPSPSVPATRSIRLFATCLTAHPQPAASWWAMSAQA